MSEDRRLATRARCQATGKDGGPCRGFAGPSGFCPWHNPETSEETKATWRLRGGLASQPNADPNAEAARMRSVEECVSLLERVSTMALRGEISVSIANVVINGVNAAVKCAGLELDSRLDKLEKLIARGGRP